MSTDRLLVAWSQCRLIDRTTDPLNPAYGACTEENLALHVEEATYGGGTISADYALATYAEPYPVAADIELKHASGSSFRLSDLRGKVVALFFGYTSCPDVCPITLGELNQALEKLGDQAFFSKAQKDDRVVIYAQAKKAILYRPSTKKIVEVAPLNIGENQAQTGQQAPAGTQVPAAQ